MNLFTEGDALLVIDVQKDFFSGGSLAVPGAEERLPKINALTREFLSHRLPIFFSRLWRPSEHSSFVPQKGALPPHCVAGSRGGEFVDHLEIPKSAEVLLRGNQFDLNAFSAFEETDLLSRLKDLGVKRLMLIGFATEYGIVATARDAIHLGFRVRVPRDLIGAVNARLGDGQRALQEMSDLGVTLFDLIHPDQVEEKETPKGLEAYLHRKVVVLHEDDSAEAAAKALEVHGIGSAVVADRKGHIVGIVTDRDLSCRVLARGHSNKTHLGQIMTPDPARVEDSSGLDEVIRLMETRGVRRIPITRRTEGKEEKCVGLVSLDDLIASREIDDYRLMKVVRSQLMRRIRSARVAQGQGEQERSWVSLLKSLSFVTGLDDREASEVVSILVSGLVGRLHHTGALYLAVHLPEELQRVALETPPGPDRGITANSIVARVVTEMTYSEDQARRVVERACRVLEEWVGTEPFEHVKAQLPPDLRRFFGPKDIRREIFA